MHTSEFLWHPAGDGRRYESTGSRSSFFDKWDPAFKHASPKSVHNSETIKMMVDVLNDQNKSSWIGSAESGSR